MTHKKKHAAASPSSSSPSPSLATDSPLASPAAPAQRPNGAAEPASATAPATPVRTSPPTPQTDAPPPSSSSSKKKQRRRHKAKHGEHEAEDHEDEDHDDTPADTPASVSSAPTTPAAKGAASLSTFTTPATHATPGPATFATRATPGPATPGPATPGPATPAAGAATPATSPRKKPSATVQVEADGVNVGFPIYAIAAFQAAAADNNGAVEPWRLFVGGGGGGSNTGIANGIAVLAFNPRAQVSRWMHTHDTGDVTVQCLAVHPTERVQSRTLVAGLEETVAVYSIATTSHLTQTAAVRANESAPEAVHKYLKVLTFSSSGDYLATGGTDGLARIFAFPSLKLIAKLDMKAPGDVDSIAFTPRGRMVAVLKERGIALWDMERPTGPAVRLIGLDGVHLPKPAKFRRCQFTADAMGNPELVTIQSAAPPGGRGRQSSIARWSFTSDEPVLQKHLLSNVANSLTVSTRDRIAGVAFADGQFGSVNLSTLESYARAPTLGLPAITGLVCVPVGQHRRDGVVLVAGSVGNYVRFFRTKEQLLPIWKALVIMFVLLVGWGLLLRWTVLASWKVQPVRG